MIRGNVSQQRACCSKYVKLAQNSISIPVSTVGMERIFSALMGDLWMNGFNRPSMEWVRNETRALEKRNLHLFGYKLSVSEKETIKS